MAQTPTGQVSAFAMRLSLWTGVLMLLSKCGAWYLTGSSAIFSDALESVIHLVAVAFATYSLWLSVRPANARFQYGFERITFFSAGFEGALITAAAVAIIVTAVYKWMHGLELEDLGTGTLIVLGAGLVNGLLGWYLIRTGKKNDSLILVANGKHVLTDCWTSLGVIVGLVLVMLTGWKEFDPICAIVMALNILWAGGQLMWQSARGLLDFADPVVGQKLRALLDELTASEGIEYHELRFRETGGRILVELHLLFSSDRPLGDAHEVATRVENRLIAGFGRPLQVTTHLEANESHEEHHRVHQG
ncbi:MAG TPA: cation diffusion facilitator family transporter [Paludibaculum sp.]|jgi:cation diffusion facilitator family transporter